MLIVLEFRVELPQRRSSKQKLKIASFRVVNKTQLKFRLQQQKHQCNYFPPPPPMFFNDSDTDTTSCGTASSSRFVVACIFVSLYFNSTLQ
jgi:hypothetical protein